MGVIGILFVCHGNICRSPMAEYIFKDMARRAGVSERFCVSSAATSREEIGNPVYPPARRILAQHGIGCEGHRARQMTRDDYAFYDKIILMENYNIKNALALLGGDQLGKLSLLLDHAGKRGAEIDDPWYTGDFKTAYAQIEEGCAGLLKELLSK